MRILIIRHGEPDYSVDSLTEKGRREAELLSRRLVNTQMDAIYVSPLGRARDTAKPTLEKLGREAEVLPWLAEFRGHYIEAETGRERIPWDLRAREWYERPDFLDRDRWAEEELFAGGTVAEVWQETKDGVDALLAKHGYTRDGAIYRCKEGNFKTIALFCHFGVGAAITAHLTGIPTMALWQGTCMMPTAVTTIVTQERKQGEADFRCISYGDLSHLYVAGERPSLYAMFPEVYNGADNTNPDSWPEGPSRDARPMW